MPIRTPQTDSATWKGLMTALQALITFVVGLILAIWQVPGVPKAIEDFVWNNGSTTLAAVGIPLVVGTGLTSFLINYFFRKNVPTY